MNLLSLFIAFVPWIAFALVAEAPLGSPQISLILGFIVAIALTLLTSYHQLLKGYILTVVSLAFFIVFFIVIVGLKQYYIANYLAAISMLLLAVVCWATILFRFPFTLQYSREGVDPERVKSALFLRTNYVITAVWALAFTLGFAIDAFLLLHPGSGLQFWDNLKWVFMVVAVIFTVWYPAYVHKERVVHLLTKYRPDIMKKA
jgi:hypothetical protein